MVYLMALDLPADAVQNRPQKYSEARCPPECGHSRLLVSI